MPITKSAKKALRKSKKRQARNIQRKERFKYLIKNYRRAVGAKDTAKASGFLPQIYKALDKATKGNVIKKNKASRLKSRLSKLLPRTKV